MSRRAMQTHLVWLNSQGKENSWFIALIGDRVSWTSVFKSKGFKDRWWFHKQTFYFFNRTWKGTCHNYKSVASGFEAPLKSYHKKKKKIQQIKWNWLLRNVHKSFAIGSGNREDSFTGMVYIYDLKALIHAYFYKCQIMAYGNSCKMHTEQQQFPGMTAMNNTSMNRKISRQERSTARLLKEVRYLSIYVQRKY